MLYVIYKQPMTVSHVSNECCQLYTVMRTDMSTPDWDREELSYPPRDFMSAVALAADYQRRFDPDRKRYDYRVHMCS